MILRQVVKVEVAKLKPHPLWARKEVEEAVKQAMGESLAKDGQKVPILIYGDQIIDGNCRAAGALFKGLTHLDAIPLDHEPSEVEVLRIQAAIDMHRTDLSPIERARLLARIKEKNGWSVTRLAQELSIAQGTCSKLLSLNGLPLEAQDLVHERVIDGERGHILSQVTDPVKQKLLIEQAPTLSREKLRKMAKGQESNEVEKVSSARFALPAGGYWISFAGKDLTLELVTQIAWEFRQIAKKSTAEGMSIKTLQKVMGDAAKSTKAKGTHKGENGQVQS